MITNDSLSPAVSEQDWRLYIKLQGIQNALRAYRSRSTENLPIVDCHVICRGLSLYDSQFSTLTGYYLGVGKCRNDEAGHWVLPELCEHSWLRLPSGMYIDTYPVGMICVQPLLIPENEKYGNYGRDLYLVDDEVGQRQSTPEVLERSRIFCGLIEKASQMFPKLL